MILVDTSVLIDLFRGVDNEPVTSFRDISRKKLPFGITSVIYQEILQGAKTEKEYASLKDYLSTQRFYHPVDPVLSYASAVNIYFYAGKKVLRFAAELTALLHRWQLNTAFFCYTTIRILQRWLQL